MLDIINSDMQVHVSYPFGHILPFVFCQKTSTHLCVGMRDPSSYDGCVKVSHSHFNFKYIKISIKQFFYCHAIPRVGQNNLLLYYSFTMAKMYGTIGSNCMNNRQFVAQNMSGEMQSQGFCAAQ